MSVELVNRRRSLGLNQVEMAKRAGVSKNVLIRLETGRLGSTSHPSTLRKLAEAYGVPITQIQAACSAAPDAVSAA